MIHALKQLAAAILLASSASVAAAQDRPRVVTVNYALQYFAERLLGDDAEVVFPVPQDVDPSFWRPSIADISLVQSADLILLNGAGFATWVDRVSLPRSRIVNTSAGIADQFIVTESITHSHGDGDEHSHEGLASYLWLDPVLAIAQAEAVAAAIAARNLASEADLTARLAELSADLQGLEARGRKVFAETGSAAVITTHPRYQYLARRFGVSVASLEWEAGATPTTDELEDLRELIDETGASVLIWEAEPEAAALEAAAALGLDSVTFETLAHKPSKGSFVDAFTASLNAIDELATNRTSN